MDGNRRVDGTAEEEATTKAQKEKKFEDEDVLLYVEGVDCSATVNARAWKASGRRVKDVLGIMEYRHFKRKVDLVYKGRDLHYDVCTLGVLMKQSADVTAAVAVSCAEHRRPEETDDDANASSPINYKRQRAIPASDTEDGDEEDVDSREAAEKTDDWNEYNESADQCPESDEPAIENVHPNVQPNVHPETKKKNTSEKCDEWQRSKHLDCELEVRSMALRACA